MSKALASAELKVTGMECNACVASVIQVINALEGAKSISVDLGTELAVVEFDEQSIALSEVVASIEAAGFDVVEPIP